MMIKRLAAFFALLLISSQFAFNSSAQMNSRNGKTLPCNGLLRILVVFIEYDYDVHDSLDTTDPLKGYEKWPKGQLPVWKDSLFDVYNNEPLKGKITQFYSESSFGNFMVLGDYYPEVITIKESEVNNIQDGGFNIKTVLEKINSKKDFKTNSGLKPEDFDNWTLTKTGELKLTPSKDNPHKWDHVMLLYRNARNLPNSNGRAVPYTFGKLRGFDCDSYSNFGTVNDLPFGICRHEFTHLFLGDNNFHVGGGERNGQGSYWIPIQCMWSVIGAANASLACCNAWDRDRLGWKPKGKNYYVSCMDENGNEINSEFINDTSGIFFIRDFVTKGDAIKIKLPYLSEAEYVQYIWIENHQTSKRNNAVYDHWVFENEACVEESTPGLYMYIQIDRDQKTGPSIYQGHADYLHPLPAEGLYDLIFDSAKVQNECVNSLMQYPFERLSQYQNPLTGNHSLEIPTADLNNNSVLEYAEVVIPSIEKQGNNYVKHLAYLGNSEVAFTLKGKNKIGVGTNPSSSNLLSAVYNRMVSSFNKSNKNSLNNRTTFLNGISCEILEEMSDGTIKLKIRFDDYAVTENVRWCSDSIIIPAKCLTESSAFQITNKATVTLDRGLTPTRINQPLEFDNKKIFTSPTVFTLPEKTIVRIRNGSSIVADNGSTIVMKEGSRLVIEEGGQLIVKEGSKLVMTDATLELKPGSLVTIKGKDNLIKNQGSKVLLQKKKQLIIN